MRIASRVVIAAVVVVSPALAQNQPAMIPTVVAQSSGMMMDMIGRTQYYDGRTPPDWPAELVPLGARVIGGSITGDPAMFQISTAVFELTTPGDPRPAIRALVEKAGYSMKSSNAPKRGGFVPTAPDPTDATLYCRGDRAVTFSMWDAAQMPGVMVMHMVAGSSTRQQCAIQQRGGPEPMTSDPPAKFPPLVPPAGVLQMGGGSSWGGSSGEIQNELRTTMASDSILLHYTPQMVAGGWAADGKPAVVPGLAVQRFTKTENGEKWFAALVVMVAGDLRDVRLLFAKDGSR